MQPLQRITRVLSSEIMLSKVSCNELGRLRACRRAIMNFFYRKRRVGEKRALAIWQLRGASARCFCAPALRRRHFQQTIVFVVFLVACVVMAVLIGAAVKRKLFGIAIICAPIINRIAL